MDVENVKARGPWVLVKPEPVKKKTDSGIYLPEGNLLERLGHIVARVISTGPGYHDMVNGKRVFTPTEVVSGDRVVFRGHLKNANMVGRIHCFLNMKDLVGILDDDAELDLSLPYDN